jgi:hypothetical protein
VCGVCVCGKWCVVCGLSMAMCFPTWSKLPFSLASFPSFFHSFVPPFPPSFHDGDVFRWTAEELGGGIWNVTLLPAAEAQAAAALFFT